MLDLIEKEDFPAQAAAKGEHLAKGLEDALGDHPHVGDIRGLGLMRGVEYVKERGTKEPFDPKDNIGPRIHAATVERGMFSRVRGDVYCIAPPIVTSEQDIDRIVEILADATRAVLG
jgi:adenosylmethionine-8-amino-7-oxononanoate aminotransferase